jgi:hypothetical protein
MCRVVEPERRVPRLELLPALEEADDLAVVGIPGIPYQVFGERAGALAFTTAWILLAMARSGSCISAIFASTSASPSASPERCLSRTSSLIAAFSSSVNTERFAAVPLADFLVAFLSGMAFVFLLAEI